MWEPCGKYLEVYSDCRSTGKISLQIGKFNVSKVFHSPFPFDSTSIWKSLFNAIKTKLNPFWQYSQLNKMRCEKLMIKSSVWSTNFLDYKYFILVHSYKDFVSLFPCYELFQSSSLIFCYLVFFHPSFLNVILKSHHDR